MISGFLMLIKTIHQGNIFYQDGFYSKPSLEKLYEYASKNKAAKPFWYQKATHLFQLYG